MAEQPKIETAEDDFDPIITCWCGARGKYSELFADDFGGGCGGTGILECMCGGDFCVCHHHGEQIECEGCDDCEADYDDGDFDGGYYDDGRAG